MSLLRKVAAFVGVVLVVSAAGVGAALSTGVLRPQPPTVRSVDNQWGTVTPERTGIRTSVVVDNPNRVGIPGVVGVSYDVSMNDVQVAHGSSGGLSLSPGRNELALRTDIDNAKIPAWWASHINNGERTTVSVEPTVHAPFVSKALPAQERTFRTDLLSSFDSTANRSMTVGGRTLLTVERTRASWGHATRERTPLRFAATVRNPNDAPVSFSKLGYEVSMNDVTLANGTTDGGVSVGADATDTVRINATLDNSKLDEWWVSHLQNGEQTTLDVQVFAVVDTDRGTRRIPLSFLSKRVAFQTDILGGGTATSRVVETNRSLDFETPAVSSVESDWSTAGSGTRFSTAVVVDNPNDANSTLGDVLVDANYRASLNDVTLFDDETTTTLQPGRNRLELAADVSNRTIRRWWVSHIDNGEQTTLTASGSAVADLGFARVPVSLPARNRTFETDMLAGFSSADEQISIRGRPVARLHGVTARWGDATLDRTPMKISGRITNERSRSLTVVKFGYEVRANDVVLADNESHVGRTIPGGATRTVATTGYLDNAKIPAWWASHLDRGERTDLSVSYYAVVEYRGHRFRVALDSMSYNQTVTTNAFGGA